MRVAVRETKRLRSAFSFTVSATIHAIVLGWVALAPLVPPARPSLYDQEIRPYENKIVWYNLNERMPSISPPHQDARPARALRRAQQSVVAGPRENERPPQLIWTPAPEIAAPQIVPAPNVVALTRPAQPLRDFTLPPELLKPNEATPTIPDAPQVAIELKPLPVAPPSRPQPRPFVPREEKHSTATMTTLPSAPELAVVEDRTRVTVSVLPPVQPARRAFIPPVEAAHALVEEPKDLAPPPAIAAATPTPASALAEVKAARVLRGFSPPARRAEPPTTSSLADAPAVNAATTPEPALAIVSLFPTREAAIPSPRASQTAGFSTAPQPRSEGGNSTAETSQLTVPGLLVHNESKEANPMVMAALQPPTSRANLAAAAHSVPVPAAASVPAGVRVSSPPDPRLSGRVVYSIAIQMPNISSYSGSWLVWFAEREPLRDRPMPNMQAPLPLRKVDPKYIPAALDEKVEGFVRLAAVIRKDGHVDHVELIRHLDERLDQSSLEALAKWQFEPAARNGVPIEVDAVFEIPFHIAPKVPK